MTKFNSWTSLLIVCLAITLSSLASQAELKCNGSPQLCQKRYNEVTYATSHNGESNRKNQLLDLIPGSNISNQDRSMMLQFEDGIHAMKFPVHLYEESAYACHGLSDGLRATLDAKLCGIFGFFSGFCENILTSVNPCVLDPASKPLDKILATVKSFLDSHANEVLTLFIENDAAVDFQMLDNQFRIAQLSPYLHSQNMSEPWPTLEQMIQSGKRLVVFDDHDVDKKGNPIQHFPQFNSTSAFVWQSRYTFYNIEELKNDDPYQMAHTEQAFTTRNDPPHNKLWVLQHFVTPTLGGSDSAANVVNQENFLGTRVEKYRSLAGTSPNFIWVDFEELPQPSPGVFAIVDKLNSSNSF